MRYNKNEWMRQIDDAITAKLNIEHKTKTGKTVTIKMNMTVGFIAYHLADKRATWETGQGVWCSQAKLAEQFNASRQTISDAFTILSALGFLVRDVTKEKPGGTNFYDLQMATLSSLKTGGVSTEDRGCPDSRQGVSPYKTQTTKRTTHRSMNRKTKGEFIKIEDKEEGQAEQSSAPASAGSISPIDKPNHSSLLADTPIEVNRTEGAILEDETRRRVREFRKNNPSLEEIAKVRKNLPAKYDQEAEENCTW